MDIQNIYNNFQAEWIGKRVDFDHSFGYQCVDLIRQYWYEEFGIGNAAGGVANAVDYGNEATVPKGLLTRFQLIHTSNPQTGDVVVLSFNHIGIANGVQDSATFQMLDQNGGALHNGDGLGSDEISIHTYNKTSIVGILRPLPSPAQPTYSVIETYPNGKQIKLNKQPTNLWGMNYDNFEYMSEHPVEVHNAGEIWTVTNKVHHNITNYDYYRREGQIDGFNVLDCDDYTPPDPVPYTPPAAPVTVKQAEKYTLVTTLPYFGSAEDCQYDKNAISTIAPGTYYVWGKGGANNIYYNLTTDNTKNQNKWVNIIDNKVTVPVAVKPAEPKPEPVVSTPVEKPVETESDVRATYRSLLPDSSPVSCRVLQTFLMTDRFNRGHEFTINALKKNGTPNVIHVYGTFMQGGRAWALVHVNDDPNLKYSPTSQPLYFYGIPIASAMPNVVYGPYMKPVDPTLTYVAFYASKLYDFVMDGILRKRPKTNTTKQ